MLTQEEFTDVLAMRRQGLSISEIAGETGYHAATISKWLKAGGPPPARAATTPAAIDARWSARIDELLRVAPLLLATSVFEMLRAEGYTGSYRSVVRELRSRRGPRCLATSMDGLTVSATKAGASAGVLGAGWLLLEHLFQAETIDRAVATGR